MTPSITGSQTQSSAFSNLDEMRDVHLHLLEVCDPDGGTTPVSLESELSQFIQAGSALGRQLSSPKERQEAQALLNFWTSSLSSGRSSKGPSGHADIEYDREKALSIFNGVVTLMPFDEKAADELAKRALASIKPKTPAEDLELTRLLAGLIRLDDSTGDVTLAYLPEDDSVVTKDGRPTPVAHQLWEAGVLRKSVRADGKGTVSLSSESLIQRWPFLQSVCQNRKALAQAAKSWEKTARHRAALQPGSPLVKVARAYRDLSRIEQEFIEESREFDRNRLLIGAGIALLVLLFAVIYLFYSQTKQSNLTRKLQLANDKLKNINEELLKANEEISLQKSNAEHSLDLQKQAVIQEQKARTKAEEAETKAESAAQTEKSLRTTLEQQVDLLQTRLDDAQRNAKLANDRQTEAQKYQAQLEELAKSLSKFAVVPKQTRDLVDEYARKSPRTDVFSGAQAEVFVSGDNPEFLTKAQKFVDALRNAGIEFPVPRPQVRKHVPDSISEVRYYYNGDGSSDKALAQDVMNLLIGAGIPKNKIRIWFENDKTAPQKFIQVSLANNAFAH